VISGVERSSRGWLVRVGHRGQRHRGDHPLPGPDWLAVPGRVCRNPLIDGRTCVVHLQGEACPLNTAAWAKFSVCTTSATAWWHATGLAATGVCPGQQSVHPGAAKDTNAAKTPAPAAPGAPGGWFIDPLAGPDGQFSLNLTAYGSRAWMGVVGPEGGVPGRRGAGVRGGDGHGAGGGLR
jgi:hypothetical protein